jgi:hypothetical protein
MAGDNWIKVHTVENVFEEDLLKDAFDREEIEYLAREHKETAYDGLFILQKGYATFFVKQKDETSARNIIDNLKKISHASLSED